MKTKQFLCCVVSAPLVGTLLSGCGGGGAQNSLPVGDGVVGYTSSICSYVACQRGMPTVAFNLIKPDGTNLQKQGEEFYGVLSPNGRYSANVFVGYRSFGGIGITDLQTGKPVDLSSISVNQNILGGGSFVWRPDSQQVLLTIGASNSQGVYVEKKFLFDFKTLSGQEYNGPPFFKWFPNGYHVLSRAADSEAAGLYIRTLDGKFSQKVPHTENSRFADISPNGQTLIFSATLNGNTDIYSIRVDGSNFQRLTTETTIEDQPDFSPDGRKIAFRRVIVIDASNPGGEGNKGNNWTMNADGTNQFQLTTDDIATGPQWVAG